MPKAYQNNHKELHPDLTHKTHSPIFSSLISFHLEVLNPHQSAKEVTMGKWDFGITMMLVGMGGTLLTLWILILLMGLLKRIFPISQENETPEKSTS